MFVVPLLLLENRTQKENFELSWFLLLLCPAGLCTTVHVTTSMRENPDIGLGHHTARWPLLKTNSFLRPSLTTTSPVFVQSADVSKFSPNPTLIPWSWGWSGPVSDKPLPGALARMAGKVSFPPPGIASSTSWAVSTTSPGIKTYWESLQSHFDWSPISTPSWQNWKWAYQEITLAGCKMWIK